MIKGQAGLAPRNHSVALHLVKGVSDMAEITSIVRIVVLAPGTAVLDAGQGLGHHTDPGTDPADIHIVRTAEAMMMVTVATEVAGTEVVIVGDGTERETETDHVTAADHPCHDAGDIKGAEKIQRRAAVWVCLE